MPVDEQLSDPSSEVVEAEPPQAIPAADTPEYQQWRMTGKVKQAPPAAAESGDSATQVTQEKQDKGKTEQRFKDLLKDRKEAREEADRYKAELERLKAGSENKPESQPEKNPAKLTEPQRPKEADFSEWGKFLDAKDQYFAELAEYKAKVAVEAYKTESREEAKNAEVAARNAELEASLSQRLTAAKEKYTDFEEVATKLPITSGSALDSFLLDTEALGDVMYWLGENRDECKRLNELSGWKAVRELTALEAKFAEKPKPNGKLKEDKPADLPRKKVVSDAHEPPTELRGGDSFRNETPIELAARFGKDFDGYRREMNRRDIAKLKGN